MNPAIWTIVGSIFTVLIIPLLAYFLKRWMSGDAKAEQQKKEDAVSEKKEADSFVSEGKRAVEINESIKRNEANGEKWAEENR